ncbi:molting protein mlt-4 [Anaeramoeba flamelloides]|uniref:Molting protein mlt-4 n=1 Tax=Anaeramoeba flamelloides TaxID=1746091 RepID=A0AAV8AAL8_9EUKA|nr:molting protein mlt-4 [Anaeramoeba flamelloides]
MTDLNFQKCIQLIEQFTDIEELEIINNTNVNTLCTDNDLSRNKTVLHFAVQSQKVHYELLEYFFLLGANPNIQDDHQKKTAFHYLSEKDNIEFKYLKLFAENKGDITVKDKQGCTVFHYLLLNQDISEELINFFLKTSSKLLYLKDFHEDNCFHFLFRNKYLNTSILKKIMTYSNTLINFKNYNQLTPFHELCKNESINLKTYIYINEKIVPDLESKDKYDRTFLHFLCSKEKATNLDKILKYFLNFTDYNLLTGDCMDKTPLDLICSSQYMGLGLMKWIVFEQKIDFSKENGSNSFFLLCSNDHIKSDIIQFCIDNCNIDFSLSDKEKMTPFHLVFTRKNFSPKVIRLIAKKSKPSLMYRDDFLRVPLHYFAENKSENYLNNNTEKSINSKSSDYYEWSTLKFKYFCSMIKVGSSLLIQDSLANTPIHLMIDSIGPEILQWLFKKYSDIGEAISKPNNSLELPLHILSLKRHNNDEMIKIILKRYPSHSFYKNEDGTTPFHNYCQNNHLLNEETLGMFLKSASKLNHNLASNLNYWKQTPLHFLCRNNSIKVSTLSIKKLIAAYPEALQCLDSESRTPLMLVCDNQEKINLHLIKFLIQNNLQINQENKEKQTALHYLCSNDLISFKSIQMLIENGSDCTKVDVYGNLPFHYYCQRKILKLKMIKYLLANNSNIEHQNKNLETPLHFICQNEHLKFAVLNFLLQGNPKALFIKNTDEQLPLHFLCKNPSISEEILSLILKYQQNFDHVDKFQSNPLYYLCKNTKIDLNMINTVFPLISNNQDFNKKFKYFFSQLCLNENISYAIIKYFESNHNLKLFINIKGENGMKNNMNSPLHHICKNGNVNFQIIKLFLKYWDLDINLKGGYSQSSPLHLICQNDKVNIEILKLFLDSGANVNQLNQYNQSPLHLICGNPSLSIEIFDLFTKHGADPLIKTNDKQTPLHYIVKNTNMSSYVLEKLLLSGVDINLKDNYSAIYLMIKFINFSKRFHILKHSLDSVEMFLKYKPDLLKRDSRGLTVIKINKYKILQLLFDSYFEDSFINSFKNLYRNQILTDAVFKGKKVHKFLIEYRIGKTIPELELLLKNYADEEIVPLIQWVYGHDQKLLKIDPQILQIVKIKNLSQRALIHDISLLFNRTDLSDFKIISNEKEINVHKIVLIARSPLFAGMFSSIEEQNESICDQTEKSFQTIYTFLKFLYSDYIFTGDLNQSVIEEIADVFYFYQVDNKKTQYYLTKFYDYL